MTGGGSESILTMMKACRDYARYVKGVRQPEMIIGDSAHAAYFKGAEYFKIKLVMVPVGADYRLSGKAVRKAVTRNTILVVASAPGFPHGVVDHIEAIAQVQLYSVHVTDTSGAILWLICFSSITKPRSALALALNLPLPRQQYLACICILFAATILSPAAAVYNSGPNLA